MERSDSSGMTNPEKEPISVSGQVTLPPVARRFLKWGIIAWASIGVLVIGAIGLVANLVALRLLGHSHGHDDDSPIHVRAASLEVMMDLIGSVAVLVGAGLVALTGSPRFDPIVSLLIGGLILPRAVSLLRAWISEQQAFGKPFTGQDR